MSNAQKMMIAVFAVFGIAFFMVGDNKRQTTGEQKSAAMIRDLANMQRIAHKKCKRLVKQHTGSQVISLVSNTETDKATFLTLEWEGEEDDNFKHVSCTMSVAHGGGISKFVVDGNVIIDKDKEEK